MFRGPTTHVGLRTVGDDDVVAHVPDDRAIDGLRPGDKVWATWDRDAAYTVPAPTASNGGTP